MQPYVSIPLARIWIAMLQFSMAIIAHNVHVQRTNIRNRGLSAYNYVTYNGPRS